MSPKLETIKHANWMELFFDLVFVFAIAKATHVLSHLHEGHLDWSQLGIFVLIMIPIWWAWTGHTMFATRFDTEDTTQRFLTLVQMLAVVFFTSFISPDFDRNYHGFLFSYLAIRILLILMYARASSLMPEAIPISKHLGIGFSIGLTISFTSIFVDPPFRYLWLYSGILIEILTPFLCRKTLKLISVNSHHMPERFGLLTIILLGETVIAIATKLGDLTWILSTPFMAINGFIAICAVWWLYFETHEEKAIGKELGTGQRILYGHLGIYCALSTLSVAISFSISGELNPLQQTLLTTIGVITFLASFFLCYGKKILSSRAQRIAMIVFFISISVIYSAALLRFYEMLLFM